MGRGGERSRGLLPVIDSRESRTTGRVVRTRRVRLPCLLYILTYLSPRTFFFSPDNLLSLTRPQPHVSSTNPFTTHPISLLTLPLSHLPLSPLTTQFVSTSSLLTTHSFSPSSLLTTLSISFTNVPTPTPRDHSPQTLLVQTRAVSPSS